MENGAIEIQFQRCQQKAKLGRCIRLDEETEPKMVESIKMG